MDTEIERRAPRDRLARSSKSIAFGTAALAASVAWGSAYADPLASPSMTAPLSGNPNPTSFDAGPLGKVYVTGAVSGLALAQSHHTPGDDTDLLDVSNGQAIIQTTTGFIQFYIQAGAYSLPSLGTGYVKAGSATEHFFSALPVAYVKLAPTSEISFQIGKLPTLIGSEYTFTFQNMNIERGLLWNQEPAISQGAQANYAKGPLTLSVSINDGFYSDHYNWVSGLASYAFSANDTLAFAGGVNFASTDKSTLATPIAQNNGNVIDVLYSHTAGPLTVSPYFQYTHTPEKDRFGLYRSASTYSGAVLAKYSFTPMISLAGRVEYVSSQSSGCGPQVGEEGDACIPTNLLYGPGSNAFSVTLTPTYQNKLFFARGEVSYVRAGDFTSGFGFGANFNDRDQVRGLVETGVLF